VAQNSVIVDEARTDPKRGEGSSSFPLVTEWFNSIKDEVFVRAAHQTRFFWEAAQLVAEDQGLDELLSYIPQKERSNAWFYAYSLLQQKARLFKKQLPPTQQESHIASLIVSALLESDD
jgi:hypothetical protein